MLVGCAVYIAAFVRVVGRELGSERETCYVQNGSVDVEVQWGQS